MIWQNLSINFFVIIISSSSLGLSRNKKDEKSNQNDYLSSLLVIINMVAHSSLLLNEPFEVFVKPAFLQKTYK